MFAVLFLAGVILSASLAYAGIVRGELKFSKESTLTGRAARNVGFVCVGIMVALLAGAAWAVWTMTKGK